MKRLWQRKALAHAAAAALSSTLMATCLGADSPRHVLSLPAADSTLQIAVSLPAEANLDASRAWQLVETGGAGSSVPADLEPIADTGKASFRTGQLLVASVAGRAGASGVRRFQLVEAKPAAGGSGSPFRFGEVDDKSLGLWEGQRPVLVYNHGVHSKPGVPADRDRATYIHPIYGLDGEVLTDDFPEDHYHHRGLFWAWPHVRIGGTNYDLWDLRGIQQRFERWLDRRTGTAAAILGVENGWYVGQEKVMHEYAWFRVYPASPEGQVIDADLTWTPTDSPVTLEGAEGKSYGGFTLRFAPRTGTTITTPLGNKPDDLTVTRLAWADLSAQFAGARQPSGAAIFISPDHPDYPPTWMTRHYGALCVGWPGVTPATFQPGERIHCRYRVWIHRGQAAAADLTRESQAYEMLSQIHWDNPVN